jgi:hypothetical protein
MRHFFCLLQLYRLAGNATDGSFTGLISLQ